MTQFKENTVYTAIHRVRYSLFYTLGMINALACVIIKYQNSAEMEDHHHLRFHSITTRYSLNNQIGCLSCFITCIACSLTHSLFHWLDSSVLVEIHSLMPSMVKQQLLTFMMVKLFRTSLIAVTACVFAVCVTSKMW